jgi:protein-disulfide isomerase
MRTGRRGVWRVKAGIVAGVLGAVLAGVPAAAQQPADKAQAPTDVVATIAGQPVTLAEVDQRALNMPASNFGNLKLSQAIYEARRATLDEIIGLRLIDADATARGIDEMTLITQEITSKVAPVTDQDVTSWYNANQDRVQGATLDQVRQPIQQLLRQQRLQTVRDAYVERLKLKTPVRILLEAPRVQVEAAGRPSKGPADAPVELIEFSDFQCPFCLRAFPIVKQVMAAYPDSVRLVYRNYPLPGHPRARPAAEAAACAADQGKFWEYHDRLFENQDKLSDDDLKAHAVALGLDAAKFNACFDATAHKADVDADIAAGNEAGVTGTPAFFINGRLLSGAQPLEAFKQVIDEELQRAKQAGR